MRMRDPVPALVGGGLALGVLLALATPTTMRAAPQPAWRKAGAATAGAISESPPTFSAASYEPDPAWGSAQYEVLPVRLHQAPITPVDGYDDPAPVRIAPAGEAAPPAPQAIDEPPAVDEPQIVVPEDDQDARDAEPPMDETAGA